MWTQQKETYAPIFDTFWEKEPFFRLWQQYWELLDNTKMQEKQKNVTRLTFNLKMISSGQTENNMVNHDDK